VLNHNNVEDTRECRSEQYSIQGTMALKIDLYRGLPLVDSLDDSIPNAAKQACGQRAALRHYSQSISLLDQKIMNRLQALHYKTKMALASGNSNSS